MNQIRVFILMIFAAMAMFPAAEPVNAGMSPAVLKIYDESELEELEAAGVIIERRRGDILLCYLPSDDNDEIFVPNNDKKAEYTNSSFSGRGEIKRYGDGIKRDITFRNSRKGNFRNQWKKINNPTLDEAIEYYNAYRIQKGEGFEKGYTGKGVVVGFCDIGFDPLHPTFLDERGESRVKRLTQYREFDGERIVLEGNAAYAEWKTDSVDKYHATHVGGILAGNGGVSQYKGVAYDADIVASVSWLSDFGLLMGVEDIIDYAKEVGKPAVINLSMGSYVGAHDGTSLASQYLDLCADDAIIVLSAGNEGGKTNTLTHNFSSNRHLEFRIGNRAWDQKKMYGMTDIWNSTSAPIKATICIFDDENHTVVYEYPAEILQNWDSVTYEWNPEQPIIEGLSLDGYLTIIGGVDPDNGRYEIGLVYDYTSSRLIGSGWAKDMISVKLEGREGEVVEIFADGTYTRLMNVGGFPSPDSSKSISDLACGHRVVSVGMYGCRENYPVSIFDESGVVEATELESTGYTPFGTVVHSSYGTLLDGRTLPTTVGPGAPLMSAYSRYYREANPEEECYMDASGALWCSSSGTSMSSPYVAGYIATWLEALPHLSSEDVIDMISASNRRDIPEPSNPRNTNGYFNPVGALRYALDKNSVTQIKNPESVLLPGDKVEIFSLSGLKVYTGRADGYGHLPKGIYLIHTPYGVMKKYL